MIREVSPVVDTLQLARIADDVEAAAYRDMYEAAPASIANLLSLRAMQIDDVTLLMAKGIADPVFARVIGLGNDGRMDNALVDRIVAAYAAAEVAPYWIHVNPTLASRELIGELEARGFVPAKRRTWAKMMRTDTARVSVESSLDVRAAREEEHVAASTAIANAFGMPPPFADWIRCLAARPAWTMMAAYNGEQCIGGGLLFISGSHAWLGLGGVLAEARRRSAHKAIMAARVKHAVDLGCTHIVTETGEPVNNEPNPSLRNMYRLGFNRVASRLNYAAPERSTHK